MKGTKKQEKTTKQNKKGVSNKGLEQGSLDGVS